VVAIGSGVPTPMRRSLKIASLIGLGLIGLGLWVIADIVPGDQVVVTAFAGTASALTIVGSIGFNKW